MGAWRTGVVPREAVLTPVGSGGFVRLVLLRGRSGRVWCVVQTPGHVLTAHTKRPCGRAREEVCGLKEARTAVYPAGPGKTQPKRLWFPYYLAGYFLDRPRRLTTCSKGETCPVYNSLRPCHWRQAHTTQSCFPESQPRRAEKLTREQNRRRRLAMQNTERN